MGSGEENEADKTQHFENEVCGIYLRYTFREEGMSVRKRIPLLAGIWFIPFSHLISTIYHILYFSP